MLRSTKKIWEGGYNPIVSGLAGLQRRRLGCSDQGCKLHRGGGGGGGHSRYVWVGMCRWDRGSLDILEYFQLQLCHTIPDTKISVLSQTNYFFALFQIKLLVSPYPYPCPLPPTPKYGTTPLPWVSSQNEQFIRYQFTRMFKTISLMGRGIIL